MRNFIYPILLSLSLIFSLNLAAEEEDDLPVHAKIVSEHEWTTTAMRNKLSQTLPSYMIPSYFVQLDQMPLTSNPRELLPITSVQPFFLSQTVLLQVMSSAVTFSVV